MINAEPALGQTCDAENAEVNAIVSSGANGAKMLAGLATSMVIMLWIAFYLLVFLPRSAAP